MTKGEPAATIEARGLKCPLPALKTRRALARLKIGATLVVRADDPMAAIGIPHTVRELGDELIKATQAGEVMRFVVRRRGRTEAGDKAS
ncbi:MAG TPA: sulfurtransferase TusA family protein [Roseiarcus sp.]|nr:sulfurtransferase TusA family protein [Roseiarcus sp.]